MLLKIFLTIIICLNFREIFSKNQLYKDYTVDHTNKSKLRDENGKVDDFFQNALNTLNNNNKKTNRCEVKNGGCSQKCQPTGRRKCVCFNGYRLTNNRKHCTDIDECKHHNGGCSHTCVNLRGTYQCKCPIGLRLRDDRKTCEDINECFLRNGHGPCDDVCINTNSSYMCQCKRNGTRLNPDKHTCDDINECQEGIAGCSHICRNAYGRYYCTCPIGMVLNSDWRTCRDIDECKDGLAKNCEKSRCINTIGSYFCERSQRIVQDHTKSFTCPPLHPPKYGYFECHRNLRTYWRTFTRTGRALVVNSPGLKCYLNCPAGYKLYGNGQFICSRYGQWINTNKGTCLKMSKPYLKCPPDQIVYRRFNEKQVSVRFPRPISNVPWQFMKSHPSWGKNLKKILKPGIYFVSFTINHPTFFFNLTPKCSFTIRVI